MRSSSLSSATAVLPFFLGGVASLCFDHSPIGLIVTWSTSRTLAKISSTYWSTARPLKWTVLLQIGHIHVGACSCNCRNDSASKHWLCVHTVERQGMLMRRVEMGSLSDMTLEPTSISGSAAFALISLSTDSFVMTCLPAICLVRSAAECFFTMNTKRLYF